MKCILNKKINTQITDFLKSEDIEIIYTKKLGAITDSVGYHPDIQCAIINNTLITSEELYSYYKNFTSNIVLSQNELHSPYPFDALFNFFKIGNSVYGNEKALDTNLKKLIKENNLEFNNVNQGYTNCSTLKVSQNAVITSDKGMEKEFLKNGIDVLFIDNSSILLEGHKNGFIGGASCNYNGKIVFFGNIHSHSDFKKIDLFLQKYNTSYIDFPFPLEDFGSALFFE